MTAYPKAIEAAFATEYDDAVRRYVASLQRRLTYLHKMPDIRSWSEALVVKTLLDTLDVPQPVTAAQAFGFEHND